MALVARYHRQATPDKAHEDYAELPRKLRRTVKILGALVRLAEGLDRSHAQVVTGLEAVATDDDEGLLVRLKAAGDAELELWAARRHGEPLAAVFKKDIRFEIAGSAKARPKKDTPLHAEPTRDPTHVPRPSVRRRGHRRIRQDDAARPAGQVARGERS